MVCIICGEKIEGKGTREHIYPRALYKWSEEYISSRKYDLLKKRIESFDNQGISHGYCNSRKGESMPKIESLYASKYKRMRLSRMGEELQKNMNYYMFHKLSVKYSQDNRCYQCGKELKGEGYLRRFNSNRDRTWDNAVVLCFKCNQKGLRIS